MNVLLEEMLAYLLINWRVEKQSCDLLSWFIMLHSQPHAIHPVRYFLQGAQQQREVGEQMLV